MASRNDAKQKLGENCLKHTLLEFFWNLKSKYGSQSELPQVASNKYRQPELILKAPSKICSRRHSEIFIFYFSDKTSLDMKCQILFSSEKKIKIVVCFSCDWCFKG